MRKNILFDLDGTLTDPKIGICTCIQYALRKRGHYVPGVDELKWCIGPPLASSFSRLVIGCSEAENSLLIEAYRERFSGVGLYENHIYEGITELLSELGTRHKLFMATSKPKIFAEKIAIHFNLNNYFTTIYGSELDGSYSDKSELIHELISREKLRPSDCVMIGDRDLDIFGAKKNGLKAFGVVWGYGSREELEAAGADAIFTQPSELLTFLNSNLGEQK